MSATPPEGLNRVDDALIAALERAVGAGHVVRPGEKMEPYTHDESLTVRGEPDVAVRAGSAEEVEAVLKLANERRAAVTPRGLGTGLVGGGVPAGGGVVLSTERMDRIREIDGENLAVVAEPGAVTGKLHAAVEAQGLFYPVDPASLDSCSIGGNVAHNAGGPRAFKYGVTRHYVTGLVGVLGSGARFRWGGKAAKNAAGYDLANFVIGTEGTLAVVTEVTLRLRALPPVVADLLLPFDDLGAAGRFVTALVRDLRLVPAALELVDGQCVRAAEKALERPVPHSDAAAHVIVEFDGLEGGEVERAYALAGERGIAMGARDALVADNPRERARLWEARRVIHDAIAAQFPARLGQDIVVPRARIPEILADARAIAARRGLEATGWGHAGDGNVHLYFLGPGMEPAAFRPVAAGAQRELFARVVALGGAIAGEHGVGSARRQLLPLAVGPAEIEWMRRIKRTADPNGILNPGKIF